MPSFGYSEALRRNLLLVASIVVFASFPQADAQSYKWARKITTNLDEQALGVSTGPGGVYVVGFTHGALGGQPNAGNRDAVVAKLNPDGDQLWIRQFGTPSADTATSVTTDATGVYVAGTTAGVLSGASAGGSDAFVKKYDLNGNELWTRQFGTTPEDEALGIASDGMAVYVVGKTQGTLPGQPANTGGDSFVRKYDANGNELWTRQFGTASADDATGVAADTTGIYITGRTNGALNQQANLGAFDAFLIKYDPTGNVVFTRQFGTNTTDAAYAVAVNNTGIYVGGETSGAFPGFVKAGGVADAFLARFNHDGAQQWVRQIGTRFEDAVYGIATGTGGIYAVGYAGDPLPGQPSGGVFLQRYEVSGNLVRSLQFTGGSNDYAYDVSADGGGIYVCGYAVSTSTAFGPRPPAFTGTEIFAFKILNPPDVSQGGVVNNASYTPDPAPLAPGSIAAVFGTNLNDGTFVLGSRFDANGKLTTILGGTTVKINGILAPMFYSTPGQLGIQIPFEVTGPQATIQVAFADQTSFVRTVPIDAVAPGIFTTTADGRGTAAVLHQDGFTVVTAENPAQPNEVIVFFVTGLGVTTPPLATGAPAFLNEVAAPVVTFDGSPGEIFFAGAAPNFVGLNQINVRVPPNTRAAANVAVVITMNGKPSNPVTIPVGATAR